MNKPTKKQPASPAGVGKLTILTEDQRLGLSLLDRDQLAPVLGLKRRGVDCLVATGRIPVIRISHRCQRFSLPKVLAALDRLEVKAVA